MGPLDRMFDVQFHPTRQAAFAYRREPPRCLVTCSLRPDGNWSVVQTAWFEAEPQPELAARIEHEALAAVRAGAADAGDTTPT